MAASVSHIYNTLEPAVILGLFWLTELAFLSGVRDHRGAEPLLANRSLRSTNPSPVAEIPSVVRRSEWVAAEGTDIIDGATYNGLRRSGNYWL